MADLGDCSSPTSNSVIAKPVIVRVKRKLAQACLDGFWLEISERPLKRPLLDFKNLSISESNGKEELQTKKLLVQHVETVSRSDAIKDILQSIMPSSMEFRRKIEERRHMFKQESQKTEQLQSISRQKHEDLVKSARFEQIWKSRRGNKDTTQDDALHEMCHVYDVIRVDVEEETSQKVEGLEDTNLEDNEILCNYLPLIREFLPTAAAEIESDIKDYVSNQDDFVYDVYAVEENSNRMDEDALNAYPLVQVDADDDFYGGPTQSEYETDDSNAEDNPLNDYPDEESSESGEGESGSSCDQSEDADSEDEEETIDDDGEDEWKWEHQDQDQDPDQDQPEGADHLYEEESVDDDIEDDWRWRNP